MQRQPLPKPGELFRISANGLATPVSGGPDTAPREVATSGPPLPLAQLHVAVGRAAQTRQALRAGALLDRPAWDALGSWHLIAAAPPLLPPLVFVGSNGLCVAPKTSL